MNRAEAREAYDDYYDAAKKDGEPFIQGENGGVIYNGVSWHSCPYCGKNKPEPFHCTPCNYDSEAA